jgi:nitrite reductase/ring-hydroxylating ferredoxin subunit
MATRTTRTNATGPDVRLTGGEDAIILPAMTSRTGRASELDRRQLLRSSVATAAFGGLCCTTPDLPAAAFSVEGGRLIIDLKKASILMRPGGAVKVVDLNRELNLIVIHSEKYRFAALERSCTHGGAQVVYNRHNRTVQCTSWGHSEFALDGLVLGGSAKEALRAYPVRRRDERLEIELGARP